MKKKYFRQLITSNFSLLRPESINIHLGRQTSTTAFVLPIKTHTQKSYFKITPH